MPFNCSSESSNPTKTPQAKMQQYPIRTNPAADESREQLLPNAQQTPISSLTRPGRPGSIAPSIGASSIYSEASTIASPPGSYRGFPSREAYMEALEDFIESKMYMSSHSRTLTGFYGPETMEDVIASRPDVEFGWQKRRKARKAEKARRMTVAPGMEVLPEEDPDDVTRGKETSTASGTGTTSQVQRVETNDSQQTQRQGKMGRLSRVFSGGRRATIA